MRCRPAEISADTAGTLSDGWSITLNTRKPGEIRVTAFSTSAFRGKGTLLNLRFGVSDGAVRANRLRFTGLQLNENEIRSSVSNGHITVWDSLDPAVSALLFDWQNPSKPKGLPSADLFGPI